MNISLDHVEKLITKKTKAIIFVNYGGIPCDLKRLNQLKKKHNLTLIQDAAQSLGSKFKNKNICRIC
jgi:dTDP-4-amino-4,6-dideoxygalactose transaminase